MKPLFPKWSNSVLWAAMGVGAITAVALPAAAMSWVRSSAATGEGESPAQPVSFSHAIHVEGNGIECLYCHSTADKARYAGVPAASTCMGCHNQVLPDKGGVLAAVHTSIESGQPVPWERVNQLPDHVFFDHSKHFAAGVGCERCHGAVEKMTTAVQVAPLSMKWCVDCHRENHATTDCSGCHR